MLTGLRRVRLSRWGVAAPVVFALAGLLATTSAQTARGTDLRSEGRTDTADLIREQQHRAEVQERDVGQLREQVERLSKQAAPAGSELERLTERAAALAPAAGTVPVRGPALRVELDDASHDGTVPDGFEPDDLVVHQQDVQAVVNALWSAGAEAMMLMDQRVISTSAVRCVGNVLILQDRVYSPPYRITAIGDVSAMERALENSEALQIYRQYVDAVGLGYKVQRLGTVRMPGYEGSLLMQHATVVRQAEVR
ncbi:DUF881 domain-containing protein [Angustibacter sp. Root456]|uniref:DUF881 domain-containing protein n=1 Tax=Angustibacter sp. Root456 TaxID=1736539 RepID=UPI001911069D|nr:DUF881 domain-containing protein [Angustibacter sp. Root456]